MIEQRLISLFSVVARSSAGRVVLASNPIHSVLSRVLAFVNVCGLILRLQVEFIARIFRVVYVGAIAVLFLFVIMMLNLGSRTKERPHAEQAMVAVLGRRFQRERSILLQREVEPKNRRSERSEGSYVNYVHRRDNFNTMETRGQVLYTHYFLYVLIAGVVLLVAIIGAIVLTRSPRLFAVAKRQQLHQQRSRDPDHAVIMLNISKKYPLRQIS